jgi:serine/threonine protein kinase
MFTKLCDTDGHFQMATARYYGAAVLSAFAYCHKKHIVYRDLKPENLVLNQDGVLKVVDFGMAKVVRQKTFTVCGTPEYMAPEIINGRGHSSGADYWALGILVYEMLFGETPFADPSNNHLKIYKKINRAKVTYPTEFGELHDAPDLMNGLLRRIVFKRMGCIPARGGADEIKRHAFFAEGANPDGSRTPITFDRLDALEITPPILPEISGMFDASNFDDWGDEDHDVMEFVPSGADYEAIWEDEF